MFLFCNLQSQRRRSLIWIRLLVIALGLIDLLLLEAYLLDIEVYEPYLYCIWRNNGKYLTFKTYGVWVIEIFVKPIKENSFIGVF